MLLIKIIQSQESEKKMTSLDDNNPNCDANADVGSPMFRNRPYLKFRPYSNFYYVTHRPLLKSAHREGTLKFPLYI